MKMEAIENNFKKRIKNVDIFEWKLISVDR